MCRNVYMSIDLLHSDDKNTSNCIRDIIDLRIYNGGIDVVEVCPV